MADQNESKTPIETALDCLVYAPLGFTLEARSLLPRFVERGRSQILLARVVGKYALRRGAAAAEDALGPAGSPAMGLLRAVGLVAPAPAPATGPAEPAAAASPNGDGRATRAPGATPADGARAATAPAPARTAPPFPADVLAIPGYDSLSASQVVPRLESLTADELEAVRVYEDATRARKTILNKIAQLQTS